MITYNVRECACGDEQEFICGYAKPKKLHPSTSSAVLGNSELMLWGVRYSKRHEEVANPHISLRVVVGQVDFLSEAYLFTFCSISKCILQYLTVL